mmetsp:Transcript_49191/g.114806  ORF Transcript_49191/g.114806 Transcript_49191/m.114806 type:complete len:118 (-) Transcript_49191:466-819(-)
MTAGGWPMLTTGHLYHGRTSMCRRQGVPPPGLRPRPCSTGTPCKREGRLRKLRNMQQSRRCRERIPQLQSKLRNPSRRIRDLGNLGTPGSGSRLLQAVPIEPWFLDAWCLWNGNLFA